MFNFASLELRLARLEANRGASLRFGVITEVNEADGTARVQLPDGQNMVSHPLRVMQARSLKDKKQCFPDVGEPVACLFAGQGFEQGVVLGAIYSPMCASPNQQSGQDYTKYEDGTEIWYDRTAHKMIAKVQGTVEMEAVESITFKAPQINILGNLDQRGHDGGRGFNAFRGTVQVREGAVHVPDESITVGQSIAVGADVLAQGISLVRHLHGGVMQGTGNSDTPSGSTGNGIENAFTDDQKREQIFDTLTSPQDKLILCMPDIAERENIRTQEQHDKEGWQLLQDFMEKWLSLPRYVIQPDDKKRRIYDNGGQYPTFVPWAWLLQYTRVEKKWEELARPSYLFSETAQATLQKILQKEKAFTHKEYAFNHSILTWDRWREKAFQGVGYEEDYQSLTPYGKPDGLAASIGGFTIFALAKGNTHRMAAGAYRITIESVYFFLFDGFDFEGKQRLGWWDCANEKFSLLGKPLLNSDFRLFREHTGYGCDFRVITEHLEEHKLLQPFSFIAYP